MSITEKNRILMVDIKEKIKCNFIENRWINIYNYNCEDIDAETSCIKSYLTEANEIEDINNHDNEFLIYERKYDNGDENIYFDLMQDFIIFYNLKEYYEDEFNKLYKYYNINTAEWEYIVIISKNNVKIRYNFLFYYMSQKRKNLIINFDYLRKSYCSLEELEIETKENTHTESENIAYTENITNISKVMGSLWGICFIKFKDNFADPRKKDKGKYEEFIIGIDEYGNDILFTCNKKEISKHDHENPKEDLYTKPIFFKKEVLRKYIENPEKYFIKDGYMGRNDMHWVIEIDNSTDDYIATPLSRLSDLPYDEQLYWKSFNINRENRKISVTAFIRWYAGEYSEPIGRDLKFKRIFELFNNNWNKKFGWYLFKLLNENDQHNFDSIFLLENTIKQFDSCILSLTKILVDSINEEEIEKEIKNSNRTIEKDTKGIGKLKLFLEIKNTSDYKNIIEVFRNLQTIRSTSIAHRKSNDNKAYEKALNYFNIDENNLNNGLKNIFSEFIEIFKKLEEHFISNN